MAFAVKISFFVFYLIMISLQQSALGAPQVPCFFIFGDSLVDNGNNNRLNTVAKVDYVPYGIDFARGPTGRFTNGRTIVDILAEHLGFDGYIPPFATAQRNDIIKGVNYASGSAGIRRETGSQLGKCISLDRQMLNHKLTVSRITRLLGTASSAQTHLGECLYYFSIGNNDYLNNYFIPTYYSSSRQFTPEEYATTLVEQYSCHLKRLYLDGARKIAVSGVGQLGCIPATLITGADGFACDDNINHAVEFFNEKLKILVNDLNKDLANAKVVLIEATSVMPADLISRGITNIVEPCCKVSSTSGQCIPDETPCANRTLHLFYDNYHPTEVASELEAAAAYNGIQNLIQQKSAEL